MPVSISQYIRKTPTDNTVGVPPVSTLTGTAEPTIAMTETSDPRFTGYQPTYDDNGNLIWTYKIFRPPADWSAKAINVGNFDLR